MTGLVLSIALQLGCWYLTAYMLRVDVLEDMLMIVLTVESVVGYLLYRKIDSPWLFVVSAVCLAAILITRQPVLFIWCGSVITAQCIGFGLRRNIAILPFASLLIPVVIGIIKGDGIDIWYMGLFLFGCCGLFAVSAVKKRRQDMECVELSGSHEASFPGVFLFLSLLLILFYIFFFTPKNYQPFAAIEQLRAMITDSSQNISEYTQDQENEDVPEGGQDQNAASSINSGWIKLLLRILLLILFILLLAALIYEIVMHRRLNKRLAAFGVECQPEIAFDMYRFMDSLFLFDGYQVNPNPYCSMEEIARNYVLETEENFTEIAEAVLRLRFGGDSAQMSPEEHQKMAGYCRALRQYVYEKQNRRGKFRMRFIKCYI